LIWSNPTVFVARWVFLGWVGAPTRSAPRCEIGLVVVAPLLTRVVVVLSSKGKLVAVNVLPLSQISEIENAVFRFVLRVLLQRPGGYGSRAFVGTISHTPHHSTRRHVACGVLCGV
jgi:hypothetical protein